MQIRSLERGQSLLETAMIIVVIFVVVFWIFELGWLMYTYTVMGDAANEGVRFAVVNHDPTDTDNSKIKASTKARVKDFAKASLHNVDLLGVDVTFPNGGDSTPPNLVQVNVTYTYLPWLSGFINTPTMRTYAKGNMVR